MYLFVECKRQRKIKTRLYQLIPGLRLWDALLTLLKIYGLENIFSFGLSFPFSKLDESMNEIIGQ